MNFYFVVPPGNEGLAPGATGSPPSPDTPSAAHEITTESSIASVAAAAAAAVAAAQAGRRASATPSSASSVLGMTWMETAPPTPPFAAPAPPSSTPPSWPGLPLHTVASSNRSVEETAAAAAAYAAYLVYYRHYFEQAGGGRPFAGTPPPPFLYPHAPTTTTAAEPETRADLRSTAGQRMPVPSGTRPPSPSTTTILPSDSSHPAADRQAPPPHPLHHVMEPFSRASTASRSPSSTEAALHRAADNTATSSLAARWRSPSIPMRGTEVLETLSAIADEKDDEEIHPSSLPKRGEGHSLAVPPTELAPAIFSPPRTTPPPSSNGRTGPPQCTASPGPHPQPTLLPPTAVAHPENPSTTRRNVAAADEEETEVDFSGKYINPVPGNSLRVPVLLGASGRYFYYWPANTVVYPTAAELERLGLEDGGGVPAATRGAPEGLVQRKTEPEAVERSRTVSEAPPTKADPATIPQDTRDKEQQKGMDDYEDGYLPDSDDERAEKEMRARSQCENRKKDAARQGPSPAREVPHPIEEASWQGKDVREDRHSPSGEHWRGADSDTEECSDFEEYLRRGRERDRGHRLPDTRRGRGRGINAPLNYRNSRGGGVEASMRTFSSSAGRRGGRLDNNLNQFSPLPSYLEPIRRKDAPPAIIPTPWSGENTRQETAGRTGLRDLMDSLRLEEFLPTPKPNPFAETKPTREGKTTTTATPSVSTAALRATEGTGNEMGETREKLRGDPPRLAGHRNQLTQRLLQKSTKTSHEPKEENPSPTSTKSAGVPRESSPQKEKIKSKGVTLSVEEVAARKPGDASLSFSVLAKENLAEVAREDDEATGVRHPESRKPIRRDGQGRCFYMDYAQNPPRVYLTPEEQESLGLSRAPTSRSGSPSSLGTGAAARVAAPEPRPHSAAARASLEKPAQSTSATSTRTSAAHRPFSALVNPSRLVNDFGDLSQQDLAPVPTFRVSGGPKRPVNTTAALQRRNEANEEGSEGMRGQNRTQYSTGPTRFAHDPLRSGGPRGSPAQSASKGVGSSQTTTMVLPRSSALPDKAAGTTVARTGGDETAWSPTRASPTRVATISEGSAGNSPSEPAAVAARRAAATAAAARFTVGRDSNDRPTPHEPVSRSNRNVMVEKIESDSAETATEESEPEDAGEVTGARHPESRKPILRDGRGRCFYMDYSQNPPRVYLSTGEKKKLGLA